MKNGIRSAAAIGATLSLVALTGCDGTSGSNGDEEPEKEPASAVEEAPNLSEIDDLMWDSMQNAGSVTVTADMTAFVEEDPEAAEIFEGMLGADVSDMQFYGSLDEPATAMSVGGQDLFLTFGENGAYLSADAIFGVLETETAALTPEEQELFDSLKAEFAGSWVDFTAEAQGDDSLDVLDVRVLLSEFRQSWEGEESSDDALIPRTNMPEEGSHEVRDDQDVWVYLGDEEGQELVLQADPESPKVISISDAETTMTFTDWGKTEVPVAPEDSELLTEADFDRAMAERLGGGAGVDFPSDGPGETPGFGETPGTEETPGFGETPGTDETPGPDEDESGTDFGSSPGTVTVPGVGPINCDGLIPGDPGMSDPNNNYTDAEIQAVQDACGR